jgi:hypothetical protein
VSKEKEKSRKQDDLPEIEAVADVENPSSTVIYGLQGTGKTTLFATWPKPALLLDFNDKGTDSVVNVKGLYVAKVRTVEQLENIYWALKKGKYKEPKTGKRFKSLGFDTVTRMQDMFIEDTTGSNEPMSWGTLSRKQFGEVSGGMKKVITDFRDLDDLEVVFLAQQKVFNIEEEDNDHGDLPAEIGPAMMPSVANHLNASVNTIGQTYKRLKVTKKQEGKKIIKSEKIQFCLYIGPNPIRTTKIRKPKEVVPPSFLINPTYEDLMEALKGE